MQDKGLVEALKSSEVRTQTASFPEKSEDFSLSDQPSLFTPAEISSKEIMPAKPQAPFFEETAGLGLEIKAGRPKGARNKSTKEWVEYFMSTVKKSPLIALGELYAKDTKLLARELSCHRIDALKIQIAAASAVLPYVHQKQPIAIETSSEELPTINIYTSPTVYQQINNGNNQVKKEIIVDGIASTSIEEISLKNNDLTTDYFDESENKV